MNTYLIKFYTSDGRVAGIQISAYTAQDAIRYAENMPDFTALCGYPEQVS